MDDGSQQRDRLASFMWSEYVDLRPPKNEMMEPEKRSRLLQSCLP